MPRYLIESALREESGGWSLRDQRWWAERLDTVQTRLSRIGVNLNQMAKATNSTGELSNALAPALAYLTTTLEQLQAVLDAIDPADASRSRGSA